MRTAAGMSGTSAAILIVLFAVSVVYHSEQMITYRVRVALWLEEMLLVSASASAAGPCGWYATRVSSGLFTFKAGRWRPISVWVCHDGKLAGGVRVLALGA